MPLCLDVQLLNGSYDAAEVSDRQRGEWPPHPARLYCALVAAARTDTDRRALLWLETQPPPIVIADAAVMEARREGYVVTNLLKQDGGNLTHPGRTNGLRTRVSTLPSSPRVSMRWEADPGPDLVAAMDAMARRIPYLGRSTGVVLVSAGVDSSAADREINGEPVYEPCAVLEADVSLRIPYPGFLDELDAQFEADRPAWEAARYIGYRLRRLTVPPQENQSFPSVYTDVVIFGFSGLRPDGRLSVRFTEALRTAVLRRSGDAPNVLHGHDADGRPHVAFLALPDVGGPHSDGHLLGLAVAVPDLTTDDRKRVLRAVMSLGSNDRESPFDLPVAGIGQVSLVHRPGLVRPWGASPERWRQGSRRWVTATPLVLDRFPKGDRGILDEVLGSVRRVGLPEPVDVRISTQPLQTGAVQLRPNELPQQAKKRLYRHVELHFDRNVAGPVLVGAGRYLGVGLFAPASTRVGTDAGGSDE